MGSPTPRRIDCVLYTVPESDFDAAKKQYEDVLGLEKLWERPDQAGFRMADHEEGVAEIVLSTEEDVPQGLVHYLVESVTEVVEYFADHGYELIHGPEKISMGHVATIRNQWGHEFDVMDFEG